ncbi:hypothetical protein LSM04_004606 [Trypanosoma melophagium]|uniref:uncharacterized protein n=1 Tax=Trypanosoma melophagium TaxID=715481 RepID=UPI00351A8357|nr:hypothetical protein LSM04_004606 [Trypanosoma melophagium]
MFRVLGSPYTLILHQHVTYLRLKRLPFKLYCRSFTTTLLYAFLLRARCAFCTVDPQGQSHLQLWQLVEAVETNGALELASLNKSRDLKGLEPLTTLENSISLRRPHRSQHPRLHLVNWIIVLYANWWLAKTGAMYRWIAGDSIDIIDGYIRYFFLLPGFGLSRAMAGSFRQAMQKLTSVSGVSVETAPYMQEHFERLCSSLDAHFKQLEEEKEKEEEGKRKNSYNLFLLGTPHPTLADVALGATFSANFLMDDPPASFIVQKYPYLNKYLERVTGWRGGVFVEDGYTESSNVIEQDVSSHYPDVIPDSLSNVLELIEEVMPFMLSQCMAFHAHMAGDGIRELKKESLEGPWKGCSGYLLPQITNIKSLMIIDNGIYTVCARAQDLEVALLAAREVVEDEMENENNESVVEEAKKEREDNDNDVVGEYLENDKNTIRTTKSNLPLQSSLNNSSNITCKVNKRDGVSLSLKSKGRNIIKDDDSLDIDDNDDDDDDDDDADFHRVFTSVGGRPRKVLQPYRSAEKLTRTTADDRLDRLRGMLRKMYHPHYTLSTVFHGRKLFVAVIPEHEVARRREIQSKGK